MNNKANTKLIWLNFAVIKLHTNIVPGDTWSNRTLRSSRMIAPIYVNVKTKLLVCEYRSSLKCKIVWDRFVRTHNRNLNLYLEIWITKSYLWTWQICDKKYRRIHKILFNTSFKTANDLGIFLLYLPFQRTSLQGRKILLL